MSLPVTEDTPPDMLAGSMDLNVVLPEGKTVKMSTLRSTPMMDFLVQVTTMHCLSPGDYSLQPMGDKGILPFKPSTPIGALDTFLVKIVEKKLNNRGRAPQVPQSFLNSFRLQVHLPRSQLFVLRVTPDVLLSEILTHVCTEKNLNLEKYEFRNPDNLEEILDLNKTLGDYKLQELSLVNKSNRTITGLMSLADVMKVKSTKHRQNSVCDSSLSSGSLGSRSGSPVPTINVVAMPPQPPLRKKRKPAPKPPSILKNEKKDQTNGSVLISHSRESSDSSGYHEASVLSESPTNNGPGGRMDGDSPPDTLLRRSKLPPSQSFTNLTTIPSSPKGRLTSCPSNTSLNSNGCSRKKKAPPPPPLSVSAPANREIKVKSSTLPISAAEERRNYSNLASESSFRHAKADSPVEVSDVKVQTPLEITSDVVKETKACNNIDVPSFVDLDIRIPPKPRPRTLLSKQESESKETTKKETKNTNVSVDLVIKENENHYPRVCNSSLSLNKNLDSLNEEDDMNLDTCDGEYVYNEKSDKKVSNNQLSEKTAEVSDCGDKKDTKNILHAGNSESCIKSSFEETQDQTEPDSIDWEYQLPPPPTDFRDSNSPVCTDFGTVTITPEVFESKSVEAAIATKEHQEKLSKKPNEMNGAVDLAVEEEIPAQRHGSRNHFHNNSICRDSCEDKKFSQNKSDVMNELTNVLNENRRHKEKSLSVSNLYISDAKDLKKNALNYSRSFTTEPVSAIYNFRNQPKEIGSNKKLFLSNDLVYNDDITYRNYKNLEKSSSMECIQLSGKNEKVQIRERNEDIFRKPIAPVQKKLKTTRRSASSVGTNTSNTWKNKSLYNDSDVVPDYPAEMALLRQQFYEFLEEKKSMSNDLQLKSSEVIRNIFSEIDVEKGVTCNSDSQLDVVIERNKAISQRNAQLELKSDKDLKEEEEAVKVVDIKMKSSFPVDDVSSSNNLSEDVKQNKRATAEIFIRAPQEKKAEVVKRYSYQGPPSINFGTWGERPKTTRIIIKDEDYVTQEKIQEKKLELFQNKSFKNNESPQKPQEPPKRSFSIKKPGVLSHYEMFSALPRKKEISSLELVRMEDEEKKKKQEDGSGYKEFSRVPVVCGVELKKEFKPVKSSRSSFEISTPQEPENSKLKHSVSVYINGNHEDKNNVTTTRNSVNSIIPKRNPSLMPVVKGFRSFEENLTPHHVNKNNFFPANQSTNHVSLGCAKDRPSDCGQPAYSKWLPPKSQAVAFTPPPPPPPPSNIELIKLKPVTSVQVKTKTTVSQDPRSLLMDEIRNFGGLRKLKKFS